MLAQMAQMARTSLMTALTRRGMTHGLNTPLYIYTRFSLRCTLRHYARTPAQPTPSTTPLFEPLVDSSPSATPAPSHL